MTRRATSSYDEAPFYIYTLQNQDLRTPEGVWEKLRFRGRKTLSVWKSGSVEMIEGQMNVCWMCKYRQLFAATSGVTTGNNKKVYKVMSDFQFASMNIKNYD